MTVFSSAFASPEPASTVKWALQSFLAIVPFFIIRALVRDAAALKRTFYILLVVGFAESCYGIISYLSYQLFHTTFGMAMGQYGEIAVPDGTIVEPNLFGAYAAASTVGFLALFNASGRRRGFALAGFLVRVAVFLSFSRAAYLHLSLSRAGCSFVPSPQAIADVQEIGIRRRRFVALCGGVRFDSGWRYSEAAFYGTYFLRLGRRHRFASICHDP